MLSFKDRYINNALLQSVSWPQYPNTCHLTSLTAVINYLFSSSIGIKTVEDNEKVLKLGGFDKLSNRSDVGNATLMDWFIKLCDSYGVEYKKPYMYLKNEVKNFGQNNEVVFSKVKIQIHRTDAVLVYHMENHYNLIIGYVEGARKPAQAYNHGSLIDRWLVIGEHSTYIDDYIENAIKRANKDIENKKMEKVDFDVLHDLLMPSPIWFRRWGSIRHDIINETNHCFMIFERK